MSDVTRAEIEEFWESWLEVNREAERIGDWTIMAEWYAEDATYGWMYTPDEHFMAVGRDQIRDYAIGIEMDGLDGWHYDYQATVMDEKTGMIVGFWKQRSGIVDDSTGAGFEILGIGGGVVGGWARWGAVWTDGRAGDRRLRRTGLTIIGIAVVLLAAAMLTGPDALRSGPVSS